MNRVLLIGNRSSVGKVAGRFLQQAGFVVTWAGRQNADVMLDLSEPFSVPKGAEGHDSVLLIAGDFGGSTPFDLDRAVRVNTLGAVTACRLAAAIGAQHVTLVSSISARYAPGDPYYGSYSVTKRHAEELASLCCAQTGCSLAILRPTQLYDESSEFRKHQGLFYSVIDRASAGQNVEFFGSHDAKRNFLHIDDFASILTQVVANRVIGNFDFPHPKSVTLSELGHTALEVFGRGGEVKFLIDGRNFEDLPNVSGDVLFNRLQMRPQISLREGMSRIKAYRENMQWQRM